MGQALVQLQALLTLERLDDRLFRGQSEDLGFPQVFGGQVVAQALSAAMMVVESSRRLHSCHCYFLRAGEAAYPIIYAVNVLREGNSFSVAQISALQHDEVICQVMASFQTPEQGFEFQAAMPEVGAPDSLYSENELIKSLALALPQPLRDKFSAERPFDVRIQYVNDPFNGKKLPPEQKIWLRSNGWVAQGIRLQQCLLAYFTDFHCVPTMLQPHERGALQTNVRMATLDHSLWFHREFDVNEWLLYALETTNASGARGLTRGQIFDRHGNLVLTVQQEGLIRPIENE